MEGIAGGPLSWCVGARRHLGLDDVGRPAEAKGLHRGHSLSPGNWDWRAVKEFLHKAFRIHGARVA